MANDRLAKTAQDWKIVDSRRPPGNRILGGSTVGNQLPRRIKDNSGKASLLGFIYVVEKKKKKKTKKTRKTKKKKVKKNHENKKKRRKKK